MFKTLKKKIYNIYKPTLKKKRGLYCSPKNSNNRYTCFSYDSLVKIANAQNFQVISTRFTYSHSF